MQTEVRKKLRKRPSKPDSKVRQKGEWTHEQKRSVLSGIVKCHSRYQVRTERLREQLLLEKQQSRRKQERKQDSSFMLEEVSVVPLELTEERRMSSLKKLYDQVNFLSKLTAVLQNRLKKG